MDEVSGGFFVVFICGAVGGEMVEGDVFDQASDTFSGVGEGDFVDDALQNQGGLKAVVRQDARDFLESKGIAGFVL